MKRGGQIFCLHAEVRGRGGKGGDAGGIQRAGERENTDQGETDGGNVIHQSGRGGREEAKIQALPLIHNCQTNYHCRG